MSDLEEYVEKRKQTDPEFAKDYESGYENFKIGEMLKQARLESGLTQEELAARLHTKKTAISRIEKKTTTENKLLNVTMDTPLEITTDGRNIVISPVSANSGNSAARG